MVWLRRVPERFLSRPARAFRVGIALLGPVVLMAVVVPTEPLQVDRRWSEAMLDIRMPFLTDFALIFNWLGRGLGWALSLAAVGIVLFARRRWLAMLAFGVTEAATTLSSTLLKILVGRPRPPDGLVHPVGSSFPSGHAAYAGATCVALVLLHSVQSRVGAGGGRSRRWESSGWHGAGPTSRCTGCPTSSADPRSASASRSQSSPELNSCCAAQDNRCDAAVRGVRSVS